MTHSYGYKLTCILFLNFILAGLILAGEDKIFLDIFYRSI